MKILLYFENEKMLEKSGVGRALKHQKKALDLVGVEYTTDTDCDDYDIIHVNTVGVSSFAAIMKAKKNGKKVICHAHSTEEDFRNSFVLSNQLAPIVKKALIWQYSSGDYIITPTDYSKSLLEGYGIEVPIVALSNGIDIKKFEKDTNKEKTFRQYFNLSDDDKVIISVGLFFERKGLYDFVEIARQFPQYKFIWFGHTPMFSIPKLNRDIVNFNHPDNVIFPGYITGDVIEGAYSGADIFFFPSYEETEGIVVLEAMASYQNVILRNIPVYQNWMKHGYNCYMGKNNRDFCSLIEKLLSKKLPELKENAYKTACSRDLEVIGKKLKEIYQIVIDMD